MQTIKNQLNAIKISKNRLTAINNRKEFRPKSYWTLDNYNLMLSFYKNFLSMVDGCVYKYIPNESLSISMYVKLSRVNYLKSKIYSNPEYCVTKFFKVGT